MSNFPAQNISGRERIARRAEVAVETLGAAIVGFALLMGDRAGAQVVPMPEAAAEFIDNTNCSIQESMRSSAEALGFEGAVGMSACEFADWVNGPFGIPLNELIQDGARTDTGNLQHAPTRPVQPGA